MRQLKPPIVPTAKAAVEHIMEMQSEQLVDDGRLRVLCEALEFYANLDNYNVEVKFDAGERARRALETSGISLSQWQRYAITPEVSRTLATHDGTR